MINPKLLNHFFSFNQRSFLSRKNSSMRFSRKGSKEISVKNNTAFDKISQFLMIFGILLREIKKTFITIRLNRLVIISIYLY